ncbi:MAG: transposase [Bradymonadales bacterium]|nr:transposase [Bradymonadales bacterium]
MNRGQAGREIFLDDEDRERFLSLLEDCASRWNVWTHAYCLMSTHYHLLLEDEEGRLDRAMRHLDGVYTQTFNRKYNRDGTLMRGRYRSRVVQTEGYVVEVVRYLHMNPVAAGLVEKAGDWEWSSHRAYLGGERLDCLRIDDVLELLGLPFGDHALDFDTFVHQAVDPTLEARLRAQKWSPILGSEPFVEECRNRVRRNPRLQSPGIPDGRKLAALDLEEVIGQAIDVFGLSEDALLRGKRGHRNLQRLVTLLACRDRTPSPAAAIAARFRVESGTIADLARRARELIDTDDAAADCQRELEKRLIETIHQSTT